MTFKMRFKRYKKKYNLSKISKIPQYLTCNIFFINNLSANNQQDILQIESSRKKENNYSNLISS